MVTILSLLWCSAQAHDIWSPAEARAKLFFPRHERTARTDDEETVNRSLASQLVKGSQDHCGFPGAHNREVCGVGDSEQMPYRRPLMRHELPSEARNP